MGRASGFTYVAFLVVVALVVALAGVITPVLSHELDEDKAQRARSDVNSIAAALLRYSADTQVPPTGKNGRRSFHVLVTAGDAPVKNVFRSGESAPLASFLATNEHGTSGWSGPYLDPFGADPWGCQYLVNVEAYFNPPERAWVLSAGPNRTIETDPKAMTPGGDDIAIFLP